MKMEGLHNKHYIWQCAPRVPTFNRQPEQLISILSNIEQIFAFFKSKRCSADSSEFGLDSSLKVGILTA
jgi:hypothetical protein